MKLYISKQDDRDTVLMILGRNGYTVRQGKEKRVNKTVTFVEVITVGDRSTASSSGNQVVATATNP